MSRRLPPSRDHGAALLSVLVIVTLMSMVALGALASVSRSIDVTRTADQRAAGVWAEQAALEIGRSAAAQVAGSGQAANLILTQFQGAPTIIPMRQGSVTVRLRDATNCFNLNSLAEADTFGGVAINPGALADYMALLTALDLNETEARELAETLADWMDDDFAQRSYGAEDSDYGFLAVPHRTPGALIHAPSELRAIKGYSPEIYAVLAPLVCTRGPGETVALNFNSLTPEQAPLLVALYSTALDLEDARDIIAERPPQGWSLREDVLTIAPIAQLTADARRDTLLGLQPVHVEMRARIMTGEVVSGIEAVYDLTSIEGPALVHINRGGQ